MSKYAICKVGGKQYKVLPNVPFNVSWLGLKKKVEGEVLLLSDTKVLKLGNPYLKEKIILEVQSDFFGVKMRVSKFHAKANYRRTTGIRPKYSKVVWNVKSP